ncbi:MAG: NlpC/P60 family protein [Novosphingobium sp.]|nr:NlpC/P60 family protein [Novosphingobium sp.]
MSDRSGAALADAAVALAGTPFRLHGRDSETGVDCVGLVALALQSCGREPVVPEGYSLRALSVAPLLRFAAINGFVQAGRAPLAAPGDLLLLRPSPIQAHLAISLGAGGFVHAHASLGRVMVEAGRPPWPVAARWRLLGKG